MLTDPPDSAVWEEETTRYHINAVILPLASYDGVQLVRLQDFCSSKTWRPVYLDEVLAVFVRSTPQAEALIRRFPVDCATAPEPTQSPEKQSRAETFNASANAASVLVALGRNSEALTAISNALAIFPDSAFLHWERANVLFAMGNLSDSEQEYLSTIALEPSEVTWSALADSYQKRSRIPAAIEALKQAAKYSAKPYSPLLKLGSFIST